MKFWKKNKERLDKHEQMIYHAFHVLDFYEWVLTQYVDDSPQELYREYLHEIANKPLPRIH